MRKDELEDYVESNRDQFDDIIPFETNELWDRIQEDSLNYRLPKAKIIIGSMVIIASLIVAIFLNSIYNQNQSFETIAGLTEEQEIKRDEMIQFVSSKEQKLKEKNINVSELGNFANELKGLDEIEQLILGDFPESVNKEKLVKSMLQYYESKARILELILVEIDKNEKNEIFKNEIY